MNSCSDIIGCLQSVRFLPVFWNLDLPSHFACDVFVYFFFSLSFCVHPGVGGRVPSGLLSPEPDLMEVQLSALGWHGDISDPATGQWALWFCPKS